MSSEIRLMTDTFRVQSHPNAPLFQIPPQRGFPTVQPKTDRIPIRTSAGVQVGALYPMYNRLADVNQIPKSDSDDPACVVIESASKNAAVPDVLARTFPLAGLKPFLCAVGYGVDVNGVRVEAVVKGPRMVQVGDPVVGKDGIKTIDVEIVEMYLAGYDNFGTMVTIRGGQRFGLPKIPGVVRSLSKANDFPASLQFELTLEVTYWGVLPQASP